MKCVHECLCIFPKIIMVIRNHHRVLGCTVCSELDLLIPRRRLEDVLWPLEPAEELCCFSLPTASAIASPSRTGTELWWNPRPPRPFHTASCCGQCPLSSPVEKACPSAPCPGGLSLAQGCPCSPIAYSCILIAQVWCKQNPLYTLHPLNPLVLLMGGQKDQCQP